MKQQHVGIKRSMAYLKIATKTFSDAVLAVITDIHNTSLYFCHPSTHYLRTV